MLGFHARERGGGGEREREGEGERGGERAVHVRSNAEKKGEERERVRESAGKVEGKDGLYTKVT